ncbi:hypothetical protein ACFLZV_05540 [Candidatus Margulisiibacteriota bacterium]
MQSFLQKKHYFRTKNIIWPVVDNKGKLVELPKTLLPKGKNSWDIAKIKQSKYFPHLTGRGIVEYIKELSKLEEEYKKNQQSSKSLLPEIMEALVKIASELEDYITCNWGQVVIEDTPVLTKNGHTISNKFFEDLEQNTSQYQSLTDPLTRETIFTPNSYIRSNILIVKVRRLYNTIQYSLEKFNKLQDRGLYAGEAKIVIAQGKLLGNKIDNIIFFMPPFALSTTKNIRRKKFLKAIRVCLESILKKATENFPEGSSSRTIAIPSYLTRYPNHVEKAVAYKLILEEANKFFGEFSKPKRNMLFLRKKDKPKTEAPSRLILRIVCESPDEKTIYEGLLDKSKYKNLKTLKNKNLEIVVGNIAKQKNIFALATATGTRFSKDATWFNVTKSGDETTGTMRKIGPLTRKVFQISGTQLPVSKNKPLLFTATFDNLH